MNELIYHNFNTSAGAVGGDFMLVLTENSTIEEIASSILSNRVMWFLYARRYRQVFAFEDKENTLTIYFFDDNGAVASYEFGGDE